MACKVLAGKSSDSTLSNNQGNNRHGNSCSHSFLSWHLFLGTCTICPRCIFTPHWNSQETCFHEPGNWDLMVKQVLPRSESWMIAALNLPEKHADSFFPSLSPQLLSISWVFWEKEAACHFLLVSYLTVSVQFSSVAKSCLTLSDPMNRSTPGLPVHHKLPEFT